MRIALLGGSFDPLHNGHLLAASDAFEALRLDRLVFVPAAQQPLKVGRAQAPSGDRLAMLLLAVEGDPRFAVDPIEIDRSGLSYSVDTVEAFARQHPDAERFFLIGADVVATFGKWRAPRRIAELARIAVLRRSGDGKAADPAALSGALRAVTGDDLAAPVVLETRRVDISSTEIRERVRTARSLHGFVPDAVARYIRDRGLYR